MFDLCWGERDKEGGYGTSARLGHGNGDEGDRNLVPERPILFSKTLSFSAGIERRQEE